MQIKIPDDLDINEEFQPSFEQAMQLAKANNYSYKSALVTRSRVSRELKHAKQNLLWDLDLTYKVGASGATLQQTFDANNFGHSLGVGVKIPINDYSRKGRILRAQIESKKNDLTFAKTERSLEYDIRKSLFSIDNLKKQIHFAKKSLQSTEKTYEVEKKKHKLGKSSSLSLSTAQDKVLEAQTSLINAKIAYEDGLDDLSVVLGTALQRWNIVLKY